ncbi:MAG: ECF transporter S component [Clostridiaceae bacterium]|nr:ECF transporter S component [Clostridiaceae bacterium]
MKEKRNLIYKLVFVGVMAAMIFVATMFLRIEIPTPTGPTNLKTANILCLLAGMLFGGWLGGLSAGIGSMLFDLSNPVYAASAPFTLVFFFAMGAVSGWISHIGGRKGESWKMNALGGACGALAYWLLYIGKSVIELVLAGSAFWPAVVATAPKMITSGINAVVAVVFATLLAKPLGTALRRAGMLQKIEK